MIDVASFLAERYPDGDLVRTWVCDQCRHGWTSTGRWWPSCDRCGLPAGQRGVRVVVPIQRKPRPVAPTLWETAG